MSLPIVRHLIGIQRNFPTFSAMDVVSLMEQTLPAPPAVGHSEAFGGWSKVGGEICGNINEAYGKPYLRYVSLCSLTDSVSNSPIFSISQIRNIYTSARVQRICEINFVLKKSQPKISRKKSPFFSMWRNCHLSRNLQSSLDNRSRHTIYPLSPSLKWCSMPSSGLITSLALDFCCCEHHCINRSTKVGAAVLLLAWQKISSLRSFIMAVPPSR